MNSSIEKESKQLKIKQFDKEMHKQSDAAREVVSI